jgi:hypothetical protein
MYLSHDDKPPTINHALVGVPISLHTSIMIIAMENGPFIEVYLLIA